MIGIPLEFKPPYLELEQQLADGRHDLAEKIRAAVASGALFAFGPAQRL